MSTHTRNNDDVQRVRDASDIVAVVGEHLTLKPKGREYVCLCPFHDDSNPSMCVVPAKQIYHCFVCGSGGDVFRFVMNYHTMDFREALEHLAQRANIELTPFRPSGGGGASEQHHEGATKSDLIAANAGAQSFFRTILNHPEHGQAARALINRRGISDEMVERFGIGASPDRWDGLLTTINKKQLDTEPYLAAGLLKQRDNGGFYDAYRNRLTFPIRDQIGRPVAFGARRINDEDEPKYLNSSESTAFNKSSTLFGLDLATQAIKRERVAVVVEGYTDVIACHQAGIDHVVATLGTALTKGHASILRRLCDTVVLLFDGDEAGQRAADRAIEVLMSETIDIKIASLATVTDAKDPDELLKRDGGPDTFIRAIEQGVDLLAWRFDRLRAELDGAGPAAVAHRIEDEIRSLVSLGVASLSPIRRRLIVRQIAGAARVEERVVTDAMKLGRRDPRAGVQSSPDARQRPADSPRSLILGCLMCEPKLWNALGEHEHELIATTRFTHTLDQAVADAIHASAEDTQDTGLHAVLAELGDQGDHAADAAARATSLQRAVDTRCEGDEERVALMLRECVRVLTEHDARSPGASHGGTDELERLKAFQNAEIRLRKSVGNVRGSLSGSRAPNRDTPE